MTNPQDTSSGNKGFSTREDAPTPAAGVSFGPDGAPKDEPNNPSDILSKEAEKVSTTRPDPIADEEAALDEDDEPLVDGEDGATGAGNGATEGAKSDEENAEELIDAVLEAEAAAIVDGAMDEDRAEAQANDASAELAEWKNKYMRLHAEWDTYRRRQKEQAETQKALAAEKLVNSLIPVIDDLERSIDYAQKNGENGLLSGVEAVLAKFVDTLQKDGVVVIDPVGEPFEALEAQAVGTVDDSSQPDETVADVYQKGYKIGNKVLRPAMVTITQGGPKRPKDEEDK